MQGGIAVATFDPGLPKKISNDSQPKSVPLMIKIND